MSKKNIGVLMGGRSEEKEVSFNSGRTISDHLDTYKFNVIPLFQTQKNELYILPWKFLYRGKIKDFEYRLAAEATQIKWDDLKNLIDFMYIATHGRFAEDGTLQGFLEVLQIPYLGSKVYSSAITMDKIKQKEILQIHGVETPKGISFTPQEIESLNQKTLEEKIIKQKLNLPLIIKPHKEGSSIGISVLKEFKNLKKHLEFAMNAYPEKKQDVIVEEKIGGMEFTCILITDKKTKKIIPMSVTEVVKEANSDFFDYEQKYMPGRATKFTPARTTSENLKLIENTCLKVVKALEMSNTARIDGILDKEGRVIIIDPNTLTGMSPSSFLFNQAAEQNLSHTDLINHLIETEIDQMEIVPTKNKSTNKKRLKIAVILGGRTNEKEVSLDSGRNVVYKLSPHKYEVIPLFLNQNLELFKINNKQLVKNSTKEIELSLTPEQKVLWNDLPKIVEFVFLGLHGGEGENGCIQGTLEMLDLPYNGSSVLTSSMCMDKFKTNEFLRSLGHSVPNSILISKEDFEKNSKEIEKQISNLFSFPVILKPHDDGCSVGVQKINNQSEIINEVKNFFTLRKHALIEEMITGMELTVGCIGNTKATALPPSQAVATKGILSIEEKFLPGAGENQTPALLPKEAIKFVQQEIEKIYTDLGCKGYSRIDCFYQSAKESVTKKERLIFIEANTLPGMTPATCLFHQAAEIGITPMEFIDKIVELGFEEHKPICLKMKANSAIVDQKNNPSQHTFHE
ncbi:MAG: D-alanine-D-alanine ligase A [candidate division TM6 bacterium GW2011_GWF2_32_72]|nr:MAG: D-alanine-D-alanine ligase A [candidate division TM6 bacterium GW2011_GWF2_32_72]